MTTDSTIQRILAYVRSQRLSKAQLAREAGVSKNTVLGIDRPDWSPSVSTLRKLEAVVPKGWTPPDRPKAL